MARIFKDITELIGKTPLIELTNFNAQSLLRARIVAKVEFFNPAGSIKDRVALAMIEDAEKRGLLKKGSVIIEPTSGNTGIGLASIAGAKGYKVLLTMPETMSIERRNLLKAYGAELVLTEGKLGMKGAILKAEELTAKTPNAFMPSQFTNPANPEIHYKTTGVEIWKDTDGKADILVSAIGTGGTISGTGRYLKSMNPQIRVVGVEPESSPILTKGIAGAHKIQGIGAGFVPKTLDTSVYDEVATVTDEDAIHMSKEIAKTDGLLVGISSGATLFASVMLAKREENAGKLIVAIFPDTGERYLAE